MLCPECGRYNEEDKVVCDYCGKLLEKQMPEHGEEELMRFRQGRHLRKEAPRAEEAPRQRRSGASRAFEDPQPPETPESTGAAYGEHESLVNTGRFYGEELPMEADDVYAAMEAYEQSHAAGIQESQYQRRSRVKRHLSHRRMVNWAYVLIAAIVLVLVAAASTFLFLRNTESGQVIVARWGYDARSSAMWQVGNELFSSGDVLQAIEYFETAREKNIAEKVDNLEGLLTLGEAYEAVGDLAAAEEVYTYVYTEVDEKSAAAYESQVRVLLAQGREAEAAVLLETAYQQTGIATFRTDRLAILPTLPTTDVAGGYYTAKQTVSLLQSQECDIYYVVDDLYAVLPEGGTLFEEPIELGEGDHEIRAVAVNGDLVSDVMRVSFQIYLPTPLQPEINLAPGTYQSARTNVRISKREMSKEELEKNPGYAATLNDKVAHDVTFYYTIDGSIPDADSPIYTGEPIVMATNGYMTLRAVAVNGYGKQGNMKEVQIKLNLKTKSPKVYNMEDAIGNLKVGVTTMDSFLASYGEGTAQEALWLYGIEGECVRHTYPWGYATFMKAKGGWVLAEIYMTTNEFDAPRDTAIGMSEEQITSKFKDYGQVTSPSGNRGLYADIESSDKGKIYLQEDGSKIIRYRTDTQDMHVWQLDYIVSAQDKVVAIHWTYEP